MTGIIRCLLVFLWCVMLPALCSSLEFQRVFQHRCFSGRRKLKREYMQFYSYQDVGPSLTTVVFQKWNFESGDCVTITSIL